MKIGQYNNLKIIERSADGLLLDTGNGQTVLLPANEITQDTPANTSPDSAVEVFLYTHPNGDVVATTERPKVTVGECASLAVVSRSDAGLWLDWGLPQDLLLPRSEQTNADRSSSSSGNSPNAVFVYVFLDQGTDRICATTRFHRHFDENGSDLQEWQQVDLLIAGKTELGFKAIVEQSYLGLLYADEVFQSLEVGDNLTGFINRIRADGKLDLTLHPRAIELKDELGKRILADLQSSGGISELTDKSPPEAIYQRFQVSKKNYKKAIGNLYKMRLIVIESDQISLVKETP